MTFLCSKEAHETLFSCSWDRSLPATSPTLVSWTCIYLECFWENNNRNFPMPVEAFPHPQSFLVGAEVITLT